MGNGAKLDRMARISRQIHPGDSVRATLSSIPNHTMGIDDVMHVVLQLAEFPCFALSCSALNIRWVLLSYFRACMHDFLTIYHWMLVHALQWKLLVMSKPR